MTDKTPMAYGDPKALEMQAQALFEQTMSQNAKIERLFGSAILTKDAREAEREREDRMRAELRRQLTPEFLATLVQATRVIGWAAGDLSEIRAFVRTIHDIAGQHEPTNEELEPFE